ncbi:MAG: TetR/AcrR family transcriptional regulator [Microbacterium sp.]
MASLTSAASRVANTDEKIFATTIELLRNGGLRAVTVEAVSFRSGVAKTTIYRRYDDRYEMLRATIEHFIPTDMLEVDSTDPRRCLIDALSAVGRTVDLYVGFSVATALTAKDDDLAAQQVRERIAEPRLRQLAGWLAEWRRDGLVRADLDIDTALSTILGATGATFVRHRGFPDGWATRVVDFIWPVLAPGVSGRP